MNKIIKNFLCLFVVLSLGYLFGPLGFATAIASSVVIIALQIYNRRNNQIE